MISKDPFVGLEPAVLWNHFAEIVTIPRPGGSSYRMAGQLGGRA